MTLSRRAFTFASLAAAFGKVARAETPQPGASAQQQAIPELDEAGAPAAPRFEVKPTLTPVGGDLELRLSVTNQGSTTPLMVARGMRPAGDPSVLVQLGGEWTRLEAVLTEVDRREMMSRMGPLPKFADVAQGKTVELGPFRFALPKGAVAPAIVQVNLVTGPGFETLHVEVPGVGWSAKKA